VAAAAGGAGAAAGVKGIFGAVSGLVGLAKTIAFSVFVMALFANFPVTGEMGLAMFNMAVEHVGDMLSIIPGLDSIGDMLPSF
jgi:hypothetical protein